MSESVGKGELIEDIILTDAFLDYLYYANNVQRSAQKWLYSENSYKAGKFDENQLSAWLSAVKNNDNLAFVKNLSSDNPLFKQTLGKVKELIVKGVDKNKITELHRLAINAQRLRILPVFQNGIFVNIPSYQLTYYRDGEVVLNSRVIVGKSERKTRKPLKNYYMHHTKPYAMGFQALLAENQWFVPTPFSAYQASKVGNKPLPR